MIETRTSTAARPPHFDHVDTAYLLLRAAAILVGGAYAWMSPGAAAIRTELSIAFGVFAAYTAIVYAGGYPLFSTRVKARFYTTTAALDFAFVVVLMLLTGGGDSPLYRALYVWVAMLAFYFGQRGGNWASAIAFFAFAWFFWTDQAGDAWNIAAKGAGLLMHGPLVGWLVDRERKRAAELSTALAELDQLRKPEGASTER